MKSTIEKYNLEYDRTKGLILKDGSNKKYEDLLYFLYQIQWLEEIEDHFIPEIEKVLNGEIILDSICSGTVCATLEKDITKVEWQTRITEVPTLDFKRILMEYSKMRW